MAEDTGENSWRCKKCNFINSYKAIFCSQCGTKHEPELTPTPAGLITEICRIVSGYDIKQEANRWWEARLVTPKGEKIIRRVAYWDEKYRSDFLNVWGRILISLATFGLFADTTEKDILKSEELRRHAYAQLVSYLIQDGWVSYTADQHGDIIMMKREKQG